MHANGLLLAAFVAGGLGAQQWLRPWCTGNGPADVYVNAGTAPVTGTADVPLSVGFCASPTNPATATGITLRVDYECGPMTWSHGGYFKLFVEFLVVDAGACTPYHDLQVRGYAINTFHCNYLTLRNARVVFAGSTMEPPAAGGDTTYFSDGTITGPNLWELVVPQEIVCPQPLAAAGCAPFSGTLLAQRATWPLSATATSAPRRFTLSLTGPANGLVLLYEAPDPLPFGVPATLLPPLVGLFRPECFWFSPAEQLPFTPPLLIPWQYVGNFAGWVGLDASGAASLQFTVPDLTAYVGPVGYDDLLVQGVVLAPNDPPPAFGLTDAVRVFVHR